MTYRIKIVLGFLLAFFLFLPIGSCEKIETASPNELNETKAYKGYPDTKGKLLIKSEKDYLVLIKYVSISKPGSWIESLIFLWPIPFLLLKNRLGKKKWLAIVFNTMELLLIILSVYSIYGLVFFFFYKPTIWGYLAAIIISIYAFLYLFEIVLLLKKNNRKEAIHVVEV